MKKFILVFSLSAALVSCKKETARPAITVNKEATSNISRMDASADEIKVPRPPAH